MFKTMISLMAVSGFAMVAQAASLTVNIEKVRAGSGPVYVSLQTEDQFMKNDGKYGVIVETPGTGSISPVIEGIAPGTYAISVWHDDNGNGQFDMGARGPLDGWAMIGGETMTAAPAFAEASLTIGEADARADVTMIYGR
ncbi:MAG: DUF2141 domain-containing protein [Pacificimonas sp.]